MIRFAVLLWTLLCGTAFALSRFYQPAHPRFIRLHSYAEVASVTNDAPSVCLYFRSDFLATVLASGEYRMAEGANRR